MTVSLELTPSLVTVDQRSQRGLRNLRVRGLSFAIGTVTMLVLLRYVRQGNKVFFALFRLLAIKRDLTMEGDRATFGAHTLRGSTKRHVEGREELRASTPEEMADGRHTCTDDTDVKFETTPITRVHVIP